MFDTSLKLESKRMALRLNHSGNVGLFLRWVVLSNYAAVNIARMAAGRNPLCLERPCKGEEGTMYETEY